MMMTTLRVTAATTSTKIADNIDIDATSRFRKCINVIHISPYFDYNHNQVS